MEKDVAKKLLEKTKKDYNIIAKDYSRTRGFVWDIEDLSKYASDNDRILDLGCGNGRLLEVLKNKKIDYIGIDASEELIKIAKENYPQENFQVADALSLPFPDNYFHKVFAIRSFHHFPSKKIREQFLQEVKRVLKPNGLLILTVWSVWYSKNRKGLKQIIKNLFLKIIGKSKLDFGDALIPWNNETMRYYHFFTKIELKNLIKKAEFKIRKTWVTPGKKKYSDIYIIAEKK